ncbi:hypothetical protein [Haloferax elongans]|uniref:hypothetical protein n=1 Tax=Haloferax elongans TaxID=403191 RepID=UPI001F4C9C83|nr:hypothetical protein [Haloferax elongans]
MVRNRESKNIKHEGQDDEQSIIRRRRFIQGASAAVGVSAIGKYGIEKVSAKGSRKYVGVSYDTRTHITQRKCTADLNYKSDGQLSGILKIAGYNIPVGNDGEVEPNSNDNMWSYWVEKDGKKFEQDGQKLQIRLHFDGDRMVGWMTRPSQEFAKLSFSMNAVDNGATMDKVEKALNPKDLSKFDKNPNIPKKGIPKETSMLNMKMKPEKSNTYLKKKGEK